MCPVYLHENTSTDVLSLKNYFFFLFQHCILETRIDKHAFNPTLGKYADLEQQYSAKGRKKKNMVFTFYGKLDYFVFYIILTYKYVFYCIFVKCKRLRKCLTTDYRRKFAFRQSVARFP